MRKPDPHTAEVIRTCLISPHTLRVTLGGQGLVRLPANQSSAYFKIYLPKSDGTCLARTYTVLSFDVTKHELDVDFVLHDIYGPAAAWAKAAGSDDTITITGPGPKKTG